MTQAVVLLGEHQDRVLNVVKGKYGFKNKSEAVNFVITEFEEQILEPELRPEYLEKLNKLEKQKGIPFKNISELRKIIES